MEVRLLSAAQRMTKKIKELEAELKKYKDRYAHMSTEFAQTKAGSAYGVEYYDIQCKVYLSVIESLEKEIAELKKQK